MFTRRLRLCKCWKVSCTRKVAFQGEVALFTLRMALHGLLGNAIDNRVLHFFTPTLVPVLFMMSSAAAQGKYSLGGTVISTEYINLAYPLAAANSLWLSHLAVRFFTVNQRKPWSKTRLYCFFCLHACDMRNRSHQRESEASESCRSKGLGFIQAHALGHGPGKWKAPKQKVQERKWSWVRFVLDESQHASIGNSSGAQPVLCSWESVPFVFRSVVVIKDTLRQQRVQCNQDWEKYFRVILALVSMFNFCDWDCSKDMSLWDTVKI